MKKRLYIDFGRILTHHAGERADEFLNDKAGIAHPAGLNGFLIIVIKF